MCVDIEDKKEQVEKYSKSRHVTMTSELACHRIMVMEEATVRDSKNCMVEYRWGIKICCMVEHRYGIKRYASCPREEESALLFIVLRHSVVRTLLQRSIVVFVPFSAALTLSATESRNFARVWALISDQSVT